MRAAEEEESGLELWKSNAKSILSEKPVEKTGDIAKGKVLA